MEDEKPNPCNTPVDGSHQPCSRTFAIPKPQLSQSFATGGEVWQRCSLHLSAGFSTELRMSSRPLPGQPYGVARRVRKLLVWTPSALGFIRLQLVSRAEVEFE